MELQINVTVGTTPALERLLGHALGLLATAPTEAAPVATTQAPAVEAEAKPRKSKAKATPPAPEPAPEAPDTAEEEDSEPAAPEPEELTEQDVRAAMDSARRRLLGDGYEKPDSEIYQKWHRPLNAWFKNTAAALGADKPSMLPDTESRLQFIKQCAAVTIEGGAITLPQAF